MRPMWPEERTEELRKLMARGFTSAAVGRRMGISRNSAIGKAHRMGFAWKGSPRGQAPKGSHPMRSHINHVWTKEKIEQLVTLRNSGQSFEDIAQVFGVHRSCVVTKAHRLSAKGYDIQTNIRHRLKPVQRLHRPPKPRGGPREPQARITELVVHPAEPVPTGLEGGCQWLKGNAADRNWCGAPRAHGSAWCTHHYARCYNLPKWEAA